ncbi:uncharacterized protein [Prorops nasuta]|uniref:uncharacterized protein n=1 Tax=Prorops nasuta TaxID=863751 RepID=UPI0034CEFA27
MATATMGLRRRVPVNSSPTPASHSQSSSGKRSRSENNNSPSHGNLNSMNGGGELPSKKSRGTSTSCTKSTATLSSTSANMTSGDTQAKGRASGTRSASSSGKNSGSGGAVTSGTPADIQSSTGSVLSGGWSGASSIPDVSSYSTVPGLGMAGGQTGGLCAASLGMPTPIPYMSTSMATFVGNATNLGKSSSVSYLDISNMTGGSLNSGAGNAVAALATGYSGSAKSNSSLESKGLPLPFPGVQPMVPNGPYGMQKPQEPSIMPNKFPNDSMFNAYQPWVIKTYGDLAKTKTITIKKYARILRTLRGEEVNSAENSKFRFWVKSKGFHIGQPEGYDAKPADRIIGRHAVTNPGLDPPLYVPTQLPHNKALNGAEGTVPGKVYKKVAIVENFFDIIHAVHVDLEGRPGKHAGQKRTYRTITETYAFLPREAVTRFLLGCTECQRRPRTPSPTNLTSQSMSVASAAISTSTNLSPTPVVTATTSLTSTSLQNSQKSRETSHVQDSKSLYNYRHQRHQKNAVNAEKEKEKEKEEKYNPLSITNLLKKDNVPNGLLSSTEALTEARRTPESDRASSKSSASSKRKRMLPEGRTPSPQPTQPLPRPWSPGLDPKNTPIDYSLPITTSYLKHQQRIAEKNKAAAIAAAAAKEAEEDSKAASTSIEIENLERERFSPAAGLIDTNLNLLATIQHLHCQVMLALTERLRPSVSMPGPLILPSPSNILPNVVTMGPEVSVQTGEHHA